MFAAKSPFKQARVSYSPSSFVVINGETEAHKQRVALTQDDRSCEGLTANGETMAPENFRIEINFPQCASCAAAIEKQISTLSGISKTAVRPPPIRASGKYEAGFLTVNSLIGVLKALGYNLTSARMQLQIPMRPLLPAIVWHAKRCFPNSHRVFLALPWRLQRLRLRLNIFLELPPLRESERF